jgi:putative ABC transport system ATP-binding protein
LPEPAAIRCREVVKTYPTPGGRVGVLENVSAAIPAASITAVVGPSGAGKSTLLRLLAGLDLPDRGSIDVLGRELTTVTARGLRSVRRDVVAFVDQRGAANLVPQLTLAEQLGGADAAAVALGLGGRLGARAAQLSGGEQARGGLAVGVGRRTPVLAIDEPTAELDRASASTLVDLLESEARSGRTIVVATHDPRLVDAAAVVIDLSPHVSAPAPKPARPPGRRGEVVLAVRDVTRHYEGRAVLDGVSLELRAGELGVLLGTSGSGKSTLLMAIAGWIRPDRGTVEIAGASTRDPSWDELSYLAQRFALLPELTVVDNVTLPERLARRPSVAKRPPLLESLGLAELADRPSAAISVGQQQRTALARALTTLPHVVVADEPTSHQDAASAELVWSALRAACERGAACLVATNDESTRAYGDCHWAIADGRVERS